VAGRLRGAALVLGAGLTCSLWATQAATAADTVTANSLREHQRCVDQGYASEKRNGVVADAIKTPTPAVDSSDIDAKDGLILQQTTPLSEPSEIAHVQRGLVQHFEGTFINDGLESWSAIDLDRNILISVRRRIYDVRARRTHPFADPAFPAERHVGHSFARKFSSAQRTELEVVAAVSIDAPAIEAFICVANANWAAAAAQPPDPSDGFEDTRLLDVDSSGGITTHFRKSVNFEGPLWFLFSAMARDLPLPSW
jgi:hypothetical protein